MGAIEVSFNRETLSFRSRSKHDDESEQSAMDLTR
jgi:hypothetical protein